MPYSYYGLTFAEESTYLAAKTCEDRRECPICGRRGLTGRYGSKRKHIKACVRKAKEGK